MNTKLIRNSVLRVVFTLLLVAGWLLQPSDVVHAAGPWYVRTDGSDANCDGLTNAADPGSGVTPRACAFSTITQAITSASSGDTIYVGAGTFDENLVIGKAITLDGAGAGTTYIQPSSGTQIVTISANNITIQEISLDGSAGVSGSGIMDGTSTALSGIAINDCEITGMSTHGISFTNVSFQANRNYIGFNTSNGVNATAGGTVVLYRNSIQANGASGVYFTSGTLTVTENFITDNFRGISLGGSAVNATVQKNDLSGNASKALLKGTGSVVDASINWWGSNAAATVETQANSGINADFTPWLNSGVDVSAATPGFQPTLTSLWVDDAGSQVGATGRIQEGTDAILTGGTVNVLAGTYTEHLTISKPLTLVGENRDTTIIDGGGTAGIVMQIFNTSGVTFSGFTVRNSGTNISTDGGIGLILSTGCTIQNNNILNNATGIGALGSSGNTFHNNVITNSARYGIVLDEIAIPAIIVSPNNILTNNTITASGRDGIYVGKDSHGQTITGNTISGTTGTTEGTSFEGNGIYFWKSANNIIRNNTISDNITYGVELMGSANNTITGNVVTGNDLDGIRIRSSAWPEGAYPSYPNTLFSNNISGNTNYAIFAEPAVTNANASANWYGTTTPAALISGNVDYTPWFNSGTDISTNPGFQGDFTTLWAYDDSLLQTGTEGRLQEAIGLANAGGEVIALSGTYAETTNVAKSIKLSSSGGDAVLTQFNLNAGADIDPASSGVTAATVNINANSVTIADGILLATDDAASIVNVNAAGTYAESLTINKSLNLIGNSTGVFSANNRIIDPPTSNAILVDGFGIQVWVRGFRLTGATNGLRVTNGAIVVAHGNIIDTVDTAFHVDFGTTLTVYANNILDYTIGIVADGTVNARHNWWDAINPTNVGQTDAYNYRLGADVMSYNAATGSADASLADTLAGGNITLSGGGTNATRVIVNHGHLLPNVPFGKGQAMYTDTEPPCADFYDLFVVGGSGTYAAGMPVKAGLCQTNASLNPHLWRMSLVNTDQPNTACNALDKTDCWVQMNGAYSGGVITVSGLSNADLGGTPFVPSNESSHSPTSIQLVALTARSGFGTPAALVLVSLSVVALLAGSLVWKRNR